MTINQLIIMKTNRQKKNSSFANSHRSSFHLAPAALSPKDILPKLQHLLLKFQPDQLVTLVCQGNLHAEIRKDQTQTRPIKRMAVKKGKIYVEPGVEKSLAKLVSKQCFSSEETFIFSARVYSQAEIKEFRTSQCDSKNYFLCRTASEKDFKYLTGQKTNCNKACVGSPKSNLFFPPSSKEPSLKQSLASRNKAQLSSDQKKEKKEMFTVEQIRESIQSEPKDSLKFALDKQNINSLINEQPESMKRPNFILNVLAPVSFAEETQCKLAQNNKFQTQIQIDTKTPQKREELLPHQLRINELTPKEAGSSLNLHLQKGLIQEGPSNQFQSFKVAGDQSIEADKLGKGDSKIEELSSIISNPRSDVQKEMEQKQFDSLRKEIEDINHCFTKKSEGCIQKVDLGSLGQQRQAAVHEDIEINEKSKQNPMQVRYNVRFLASRNTGTEVIRLSPLRFRKKEEVVQQLIKTKLVPKQSDSINIP